MSAETQISGSYSGVVCKKQDSSGWMLPPCKLSGISITPTLTLWKAAEFKIRDGIKVRDKAGNYPTGKNEKGREDTSSEENAATKCVNDALRYLNK